MRKEKPIEAGDASAVAAVHVAVTDNTWNCIMEYEKLHEKSERATAHMGACGPKRRCCNHCFRLHADVRFPVSQFVFLLSCCVCSLRRCF